MNTENNKIIAEFMGLENTLQSYYNYNNSLIHKDRLLFHSDWNWLMKIVEKIESLSNDKQVINWGRQSKTIFDFKLTESKIEAVYNACLDCIKWYNENSAKTK